MTEYICKCGRKLQRSTNGATTGLKLDGYGPGHECFGCPYVVPIKAWADGGMKLDHYECITSKELHYDTYACTSFFGNDSKVGHILSLDWDFLQQVAAECDKHPNTITINRPSDGDLFAYKSKYREDGRFDFCIYPTTNKAGAKAKRAIFEKFFTPSGRRKDMTPEQEKEKILNDIKTGRSNELPRPYNPGDIYYDPLDHSRMRVIDLTPDKKERTWQVQESDGPDSWEPANGSVYPHFEDAVRTLAAFVRSYGLVPQPDTVVPNWDNSLVEPIAICDELPAVCVDCLCWKCGNEECGLQCEHDAHDTAECERNGGVGINCKDYIPKEESVCPEPDETALPTASTHACPAECGTAEPALPAPSPAALAAASTTDMADRPSFDYSGLSQQTIDTMHLAEKEIFEAKQIYIVRVSNAVAMVHQELVQNLHKHSNQHSEDTFCAWCAHMGFSRRTAYNLLQVDRLLSGASPEELATLEAASPSLLYAAAKPSAPAELVEQVKSGDITKLKQYQEAMARIKQLEDANADLQDANDTLHQTVEQANARAAEAEGRAKTTQYNIDQMKSYNESLRAQLADTRTAGQESDRLLKARIAELEARPIEVAVQQPSEADLARYRAEGAEQARRDLAAQVASADAARKKTEDKLKKLQDTLQGRTDHLNAVEAELAKVKRQLKEQAKPPILEAVPCSQCVFEQYCCGIVMLDDAGVDEDDINNRLSGCTGGMRKE